VQPHTRYAYRALIFNVSNVDVFYLAEEGVFMRAGTRTFMLDKLERGSGGVQGVFLYDDRGADGAQTVTAEAAELIEVPGERRPVLQLRRGDRLTIPPIGSSGDPPLPKQSGDFAEAVTPLGKAGDEPFRGRGSDQRELTLYELYRYHGDPPPAYRSGPLTAEFHKRLVNILTPMLMPVLAIPFAIGRRRSPSAYRFGIALVILIVLHEMIEQGAIAAQTGLLSPFVAIWAPFLAVSMFAALNFYRACFVLKPDLLEPLSEWLANTGQRLRRLLPRFARRDAPL
jgi:lipopolysaccharide export system permease protein